MITGRSGTHTGGRLGDKLGPRLMQLVVQAVIRARQALGPHEAKVLRAALQEIVNQAGEEVAELYRPFIAQVLADYEGSLHPLMAHHMARMSSGAHQWESLAGHLSGGASSALSSVLTNYLWPVTAGLNEAFPNTPPDVQTLAQAAAADILPIGAAQQAAHQWGYTTAAFDTWRLLAQSMPPADVLHQLLNRGLMSQEQAQYWLKRSAVPTQMLGQILALRRTLLSPADAALAVLRGNLPEADGQRIAAGSGIDPADFRVLVGNTGEPPGLMQLLEAYRRGFISQERLHEGIRQSRVRDEWAGVVEALRYSPVPTADAVDAALRGHISWDRAESVAAQNGVEPSEFGVLKANAGSPLALEQLLELWRRGEITQARVEEGLKFGRLRDDWIPAALHLRYEPLPTADAIDAWLRGHLSREDAEKIVTENGLLPRDVPAAFGNAGNPLALMQLLEAYRRGFISEERFLTGFRESRYRDDWAATALQLRHSPMSTADAVEAAIQGHLSYENAERIAAENGLAPGQFSALYDTAGEPLSRTEVEQLWNRGLMSQARVEQALRESRLKDKYIGDALNLHTRLPQAREVIMGLEQGAVTSGQAAVFLADLGFGQDAISLLIQTGLNRATGKYREFTVSQVMTYYSDRLITQKQACQFLHELHYSDEHATMLLQLADFSREHKILTQAISAVRSHYLTGRIDDAAALGDLQILGVPADARDTYMLAWRTEKLAHPKQLTEAQIVKAAKNGLFVTDPVLTPAQRDGANQAEGHRRLVALGYDDTDAGLLLAGA